MWKQLVVKNKKNTDIFSIDFILFNNSDDILPYSESNELFSLTEYFSWHFMSFEEMKNKIKEQIEFLYKNNKIDTDNYIFVKNGIEQYIKEKTEKSIKQVYWKIRG